MWSVSGNKGQKWNYANVLVGDNYNYSVVFEGTIGDHALSDVAIDDVTLTPECATGSKWVVFIVVYIYVGPCRKSAFWKRGYRKNPKNSDTLKIGCNHSKIWIRWLYHRVMHPKVADGMANIVDSYQTGPSDLGLHCLPRPVCHISKVWILKKEYLLKNMSLMKIPPIEPAHEIMVLIGNQWRLRQACASA